MDEPFAFLGAAEESLNRVKRLVLHLLKSQRQLEQDIKDLRTQQEWLSGVLRETLEQLQMPPTVVEEATSTQPQQQELTPVEQQQYATQSNQSLHSLEFEENMSPLSKKQKLSFDDSQQSIEAKISVPVKEKPTSTERELTKSQRQSLEREERAKKLSKRHQQARKETQMQVEERSKVIELGDEQRGERKAEVRFRPLKPATNHTVKRERN